MEEKTNRLKLSGSNVIVVITSLLSVFSVLLIITTSESWLSHLIYLSVSFFIMFVFSKISYRILSQFAGIGLFLALILLFITLFFGTENNRSITVFGINLQTFYLIGFLVVFYIAKFIAARLSREQSLSKNELYMIFIIISIFCGGVFFANQSTAIILFGTCMVVLFIGKVKLKYIAAYTGILIVCASLFIAFGAGRTQTLINRFTLWSTGSVEGVADDYARQVVLSKAAISNSEWLPGSVGEGVVKVSLPARDNDYIFSVLVEEFGIIIGLVILFFYLVLLYQAMRIARNAEGPFGTLLAFGIGFWFCAQALIHIAVNCSLIPSTGQTLPFISRGGAALLISGAAIGMLLNIGKSIPDGELDL